MKTQETAQSDATVPRFGTARSSLAPKIETVALAFALALTTAACSSDAGRHEAPVWSFETLLSRASAFENEDGAWRLSESATEGLDEAALRLHLELAIRTGADAVLVARGPAIVCEWYSSRYAAPLGAMSSTKSVTSVLCGILRDDGALDFDDPVGAYLPEWNEGVRSRVTIRHLLSQTSGLLQTTDPAASVASTGRKNDFVRALVPQAEPGTVWSYSNEGVQLLSPILELAAGRNLAEFARDRLFESLGMLRTSLWTSGGDVWTYADMQTTPRDFARLGLLMLGNGVFGQTRIVSPEYVREATTPVAPSAGWSREDEYGLLWWLYEDLGGLRCYAAEGYLDTSLYIFPDERLIIARIQAPRGGRYSGVQESGNYFELAAELIPALLGRAPAPRPAAFLRRIELPEGYGSGEASAAAVSSSEATGTATGRPSAALDVSDPADPQSVLDAAVAASANGVVEPVIAALEDLVDSGTASETQLAQAYLTLSLAYLRLADRTRAREALAAAEAHGAADLPGWWGSYCAELRGQLGR